MRALSQLFNGGSEDIAREAYTLQAYWICQKAEGAKMRARSLFLAFATFVLSYPLVFIDWQLKGITGFEGFGHLLKETRELW